MSQTCNDCGEVFYSDTEFREHRRWEELREDARFTSELLQAIKDEQQLRNVLILMETRKLEPEEAMRQRFELAHLMRQVRCPYCRGSEAENDDHPFG